jgi:Flp pilus assembly protein TadG
MRDSRRDPGFGRRGSVLVFAALALVALMAAAALAIDLGMLLDTRQDAQRAADAAALAGASAFLGANGTAAIPHARDTALVFAANNLVRGVKIDTAGAAAGNTAVTTYTSNEAVVTIFPATARVRVRIRRAAVTTWFAKLFGKTSIPIAAWATAEASAAGGATCVKPWAIPDTWNEKTQDLNNNKVQDPNETWDFKPTQGDTYSPYTAADPNSSTATGYGSNWRNNSGTVDDFGRQLVLKPQDPGSVVGSPGFFNVWEPTGVNYSASTYRQDLETCRPGETFVGVSYSVKNGNMVGPTKQGVDNVIAQDPSASWVPPVYDGSGNLLSGGFVTGSNQGNWVDSPRVIKVALYDPNQLLTWGNGSNATVTFNNIALFFLEGTVGNGNQASVMGRFLYYAQGTGGGPVTGPLAKVLRLVQ